MLKVYFPRDLPSIYPRQVDKAAWELLLERLDPSIDLITDTQLPQSPDYQILIAGRPTAEQLEASPALHTLLIPWAGLPDTTAPLLARYPHLAVHNLHHNAVPTAETALMLLLTAAKLILPIERRFRQHDWRPRYGPNPALLLEGKTVLILGYGRIGQQVGRVCAAMGMRVLATRRNLEGAQFDEARNAEIHPSNELHQLLPQANVLVITLPLTPETHSLIGEQELNLLPEKAILVNVGRGQIVDQAALYHTLKAGRLHSAGLDVWYNYPPDEKSRANTPPADYPFHEFENVVMSPHRGGGSMEVEVLRMECLAQVLNLAAQGKPMPNKIDLERGY